MPIKVLTTSVRLVTVWKGALIGSLHGEKSGVDLSMHDTHISNSTTTTVFERKNSTSPEWLLMCWFRCPILANEIPQSAQIFRARSPSSCFFRFMPLDNQRGGLLPALHRKRPRLLSPKRCRSSLPAPIFTPWKAETGRKQQQQQSS